MCGVLGIQSWWLVESVQTFASRELSRSLKAVIRLQLRQSTKKEIRHCKHVIYIFAILCCSKSRNMFLLEMGSPVRAGGRRSVDGFLMAS